MNPFAEPTPWTLVANGYSDVTMRLFRGYSEAALRLVPLDRSHHAADIACGPGTLTLPAAAAAGRVTAIDFAPGMIAALERNIGDAGLSNVEAEVGDGQNLRFADGSFDAVFSMFGLIFFPDRAKGFAELHRTLRPGGRACVSSWAPFDTSPLMRAMFGGMRQINPELPEPTTDFDSLENPEVLQAEMEAAGFRDVEVHEVEDRTHVASAREFWADIGRGAAPVVMMRRAMGEEAWHEGSERAVDFLETELGPFPAILGAKAYLAVGVR